VLKDLLLYPWLKLAYRSQPIGAKALVGSTGVADGDLTPEGFIRVRGERWRALVNPVDASPGGTVSGIPAGAKVEITGADRMTVYVRALPENLSAK
jgi:membrane-bound ClpP family serine protease